MPLGGRRKTEQDTSQVIWVGDRVLRPARDFPTIINVDRYAEGSSEGSEVDGLVHVLARDPGAARSALRAGGYTIEGELEVLVLPMSDRPGELSMVMQRLAEAGVNIRFVYLATETRVVIGVDDISRARAAIELTKN